MPLAVRPAVPGEHAFVARLFPDLGAGDPMPGPVQWEASALAGTTIAELDVLAQAFSVPPGVLERGPQLERGLSARAGAPRRILGRMVLPRIRQSFAVPRALAGESLDRALEALSGDISRSQAQKAVRRGDVQVDGRRVVRSNGKVSKGQTLVIERDAPPAHVLHEDAELLVVKKPAGWLTHRADRSDAPDLAAHLDGRFGPLPITRGEERPGIVHRLDRETSGLLVVARTESTLDALQAQFKARTVTKRYLAIASGVPREDERSFDAPIGPVPGTLDRQRTDPDGKPAETDVRVLARGAQHVLLECTIHTGRRHQIRVHLGEAGFPVLGDALYGTKSQRPLPRGVAPSPRLALHAAHLAFDHPGTGERVAFDTPLPADLEPLARDLGLNG